jgi:hypothetical protein
VVKARTCVSPAVRVTSGVFPRLLLLVGDSAARMPLYVALAVGLDLFELAEQPEAIRWNPTRSMRPGVVQFLAFCCCQWLDNLGAVRLEVAVLA